LIFKKRQKLYLMIGYQEELNIKHNLPLKPFYKHWMTSLKKKIEELINIFKNIKT